MGKNSRSTVSRCESAGSAMPGRFSRMKASWKARQWGGRSANCSGSLCRSARATARLATRKASKASASSASTSMPRCIRSAARAAKRSSSSAVSRRAPVSGETSLRRDAIHPWYSATKGRKASCAAGPSASLPSASMPSSAPCTGMVSVFSTSALGIQAVRNRRQTPSTSSQSAETPWPVAYSGVSA